MNRRPTEHDALNASQCILKKNKERQYLLKIGDAISFFPTVLAFGCWTLQRDTTTTLARIFLFNLSFILAESCRGWTKMVIGDRMIRKWCCNRSIYWFTVGLASRYHLPCRCFWAWALSICSIVAPVVLASLFFLVIAPSSLSLHEQTWHTRR